MGDTGTPRASRVHIAALMQRLREAQHQADKFDRQWNRINEKIARHHEEQRELRARTGQAPLTDIMIQQDKAQSIALNDAYGAQAWWRTQATMLSSIVQAEIAYREMLMREEG